MNLIGLIGILLTVGFMAGVAFMLCAWGTYYVIHSARMHRA